MININFSTHICLKSVLSLVFGLFLVSCASGPSVESEAGAQNTRARFLLGELVNKGKVPLVAIGNPAFLSQSEAIDHFAQGIRSLTVVFEPASDPTILNKQRVVLRWGALGDDFCTTMPTSPGSSTPFTAGFCDGRELVASVIATDPADTADNEKRLMWRAANRLFPDDYEQSSGIGVGIFGGSGGVGLGGGISF